MPLLAHAARAFSSESISPLGVGLSLTAGLGVGLSLTAGLGLALSTPGEPLGVGVALERGSAQATTARGSSAMASQFTHMRRMRRLYVGPVHYRFGSARYARLIGGCNERQGLARISGGVGR